MCWKIGKWMSYDLRPNHTLILLTTQELEGSEGHIALSGFTLKTEPFASSNIVEFPLSPTGMRESSYIGALESQSLKRRIMDVEMVAQDSTTLQRMPRETQCTNTLYKAPSMSCCIAWCVCCTMCVSTWAHTCMCIVCVCVRDGHQTMPWNSHRAFDCKYIVASLLDKGFELTKNGIRTSWEKLNYEMAPDPASQFEKGNGRAKHHERRHCSGISLMAQTISAQKAYVGNDTKNFLMCGSG
jgi:hypothetical protein